MERLVFYGKGGIGKSTLSANISAVLARDGQRVLHVGCDPKHDSTVALLDGQFIPTVLDRGVGTILRAEEIVTVSPTGVHCVEAGGPQAGVGCAGRGISLTLETLERAELLSPECYDVVVFDLLGDVVCGGFAAPLRRHVGEKVIIVTSEEVMSLYAANNIARAIVSYAGNGIVCAGLLVNLRDGAQMPPAVERFAELLNVSILGVLGREPLIREAEYRRTTVAQYKPKAPLTAQLQQLAQTICGIDPAACALPTPLSDRDFDRLARQRFTTPPGGFEREVSDPLPPAVPTPTPLPAEQQRAEQKRRAFKRDLQAGIAAVQRGLVDPGVALERLQRSYPEFTATLQVGDLR